MFLYRKSKVTAVGLDRGLMLYIPPRQHGRSYRRRQLEGTSGKVSAGFFSPCTPNTTCQFRWVNHRRNESMPLQHACALRRSAEEPFCRSRLFFSFFFFPSKSAFGCLSTQPLVYIQRQVGIRTKAMFSPTHIPDPVQCTAPTQESLYLIVAFDEGASGPVAREWFTGKYDGGMAWWPPYKDSYKILQSVLKRTSPNPSKGWKQYSCQVLHETNCFESVSKRWGLSCHTSDLNTDKEELPAVRQRKKPSRLRSSSPSPPSSPASCPSSDTQNAPQTSQAKKKRKTHNKPSKKIPPPPPLLPMAGNNIRAVTNTEQPSVAHPSFHQRSKPMSVRRKLAHPPTSRLTPPAHPTSSYSEKTAVNTQEEVPGLEDWRTEDFPDLTPDNNEGLLQQPPCHPLPELLQRTNDMITSVNEDLLTECKFPLNMLCIGSLNLWL
ncbi:uncharacterized protein LOC119030477 isoform X2 [Acanthopagrus latus]|uniref:uncharacterized protein LOC119030477 isoform X2 n=1 Tax=Acanthopagrus latus TaxID=8177 RepID=UPI00187BF436|nr:uncharacterized protein LOC119030477 isoform X2 [Acanthopagrus latus]